MPYESGPAQPTLIPFPLDQNMRSSFDRASEKVELGNDKERCKEPGSLNDHVEQSLLPAATPQVKRKETSVFSKPLSYCISTLKIHFFHILISLKSIMPLARRWSSGATLRQAPGKYVRGDSVHETNYFKIHALRNSEVHVRYSDLSVKI